MTRTVECRGCGAGVDSIELFPGDMCVGCWARSPEGRRMPSAEELVDMWGGPARSRRQH